MKTSFTMCLLLVAVILAYGQSAWAQDALPCEWNGPYWGVRLGGGFTDIQTTLDNSSTSLQPDSSGVIGGGQIGYNLQRGKFLLGLEADLSGSAMDGRDGPPTPPFVGGYLVVHEDVNWFGTLRPRLGYTPIPHLLIYATGGLAYGDVSCSARQALTTHPALAGQESFSGMDSGWTVGGGIEYAVSKRWSVGAQYLFCNLGHENVTTALRPVGPGPIQPQWIRRVTFGFGTEFSVFDVGVNYRFE